MHNTPTHALGVVRTANANGNLRSPQHASHFKGKQRSGSWTGQGLRRTALTHPRSLIARHISPDGLRMSTRNLLLVPPVTLEGDAGHLQHTGVLRNKQISIVSVSPNFGATSYPRQSPLPVAAHEGNAACHPIASVSHLKKLQRAPAPIVSVQNSGTCGSDASGRSLPAARFAVPSCTLAG